MSFKLQFRNGIVTNTLELPWDMWGQKEQVAFDNWLNGLDLSDHVHTWEDFKDSKNAEFCSVDGCGIVREKR